MLGWLLNITVQIPIVGHEESANGESAEHKYVLKSGTKLILGSGLKVVIK